jgi:Fe-S cluster assembly protein SufB
MAATSGHIGSTAALRDPWHRASSGAYERGDELRAGLEPAIPIRWVRINPHRGERPGTAFADPSVAALGSTAGCGHETTTPTPRGGPMVSQPEIKDRREEYAFHDDIVYLHEAKRGLTRDTVKEISAIKEEPEWMLEHRLRGYDHWLKRPMPMWTEGLDKIDYDNIIYYRKPSEREEKSWDDVPDQIKDTFERLGIPEAERAFLAGVGAQYDSEVVYHSVKEELQKLGVVFMGTDQALKEYPDIFKEHFGTVVPSEDNKFSALNSAVWSGGSFVYVPPGVEVPLPLQAYFRINGENTGQFERTLIVVDEDASVHYIEGCTAPIYATDSLHVAVVEVIAKPRSKVRYTTIQNWSNDVYNLVTKRAHAYEDSTVEWIDANTGSKKTVKYPSIYLRGRGAKADIISVAVAGEGQHQDTGAKAIHLAPDTRSRIVSKSVSKDNGRASYRGQVKVAPGATNAVASIRCDALLLSDKSRSDTYPYIDIQEDDTTLTHEATVGKVSEDQVFYLMSRGLTENEAQNLIVQGFLEVFTKELPMEYAIEFNRLVKLEMEGSLG